MQNRSRETEFSTEGRKTDFERRLVEIIKILTLTSHHHGNQYTQRDSDSTKKHS